MRQQRRKVIEAPGLVTQPSVDSLINDALNVIQKEIAKFSYKVNKNESLNLSEARVFQGYIKSLAEMARESREAAKQDDLGNMSNEEIIRTLAAGREQEIAELLLSKGDSNESESAKD